MKLSGNISLAILSILDEEFTMTPRPFASEALLVRYSWLARRHITICLSRLGWSDKLKLWHFNHLTKGLKTCHFPDLFSTFLTDRQILLTFLSVGVGVSGGFKKKYLVVQISSKYINFSFGSVCVPAALDADLTKISRLEQRELCK